MFRKRAVLLCVFVLASIETHATADIIEGPYVALPLTNSPDSGLQFTAMKDVTMTNFIFYNQGWDADTINLWDATENVLVDSLITTGGYTKHFFRVDWDLEAGHTYWLVSLRHNNGRYTDFVNYPVSNDHLQVDGAIDANRELQTDVWISFRFLTTVPSPAALALLSCALLSRRRRRSF